MAMRIDVDFKTPLTAEQRLSLTIEIACLAKSERLRIINGNFRAVIMGAAMSKETVANVLAEADLPVEKIMSSLSDDENAEADEHPDDLATAKESWRPIGR